MGNPIIRVFADTMSCNKGGFGDVTRQYINAAYISAVEDAGAVPFIIPVSNDLEKTKKIFMEYLGAKSNDGYHNQKTGFCSYFLTFEDGARIEIMNIPEMADLPKKLARTGYSHIAFSVGSIEKVDALTAELKADGYEVISGPRTTGDGYYESCIVAVEDNQIEITV